MSNIKSDIYRRRHESGVMLNPNQNPSMPQTCRCEKPLYITDEQNSTRCFLCGKAPKV